jgi:hypothetical protein
MVAGVVLMMAVTAPGAGVHMPAQGRRAALGDAAPSLPLLRTEPSLMLAQKTRLMPQQNIS